MAIITFGDGTNAGYAEGDNGGGASTTVTAVPAWAQAAGDILIAEVAWDVANGTLVNGGPTDTKGNVWVQVGTTIHDSGNFFNQAMFVCLAAKTSAASANTVTLQTTLSAGGAGSTLIAVFGFHAPGYYWAVDQFAHASGSSTAPAPGSVTSKNPNSVWVAACACGNTATTPAPSSPWNNEAVDALGGQQSYFIATTTQSQNPTYTQAPTGVWTAQVATFAAEPIPSASFPSSGSYASDAREARHAAQALKKPTPPAAAFTPRASFPDQQSAFAGTASATLEAGSGTQATPTLFLPLPPPVFPDSGIPARSVANDFFAGRFFAFVAAAKNPSAVYPDAGNQRTINAGLIDSAEQTKAFLAVPLPRAAFPDQGQAAWRNTGDSFFEAVARLSLPAFNPSAVFPDAGQPAWRGSWDPSPMGVRAFELPAVVPSGAFPDRGQAPWQGGWDPSLLGIVKFLIAAPKPTPVYPDRGNQRPVDPLAHDEDGAVQFFAPAVSRVWPAVFSDTGSQQAPPAWRGPWQSGLTYVAPVPLPRAVFPDVGSGYLTPASAHLASVAFFTSPRPTPSGSFPDRGYGYLTPPTAHLESTRYPFPPPAPPYHPLPLYPDVGSQPYAVPVGYHMAASGLTFVPPIPKPSGSFPDRGSAWQAPSHLYAFDLNVVPPPLNPLAVFPDRGQEPPPRVHMAASGPPWVAPVPTPSGVYPDRGSAWQPPSHLYALALRIPPPPVNPIAVYPDRGQPPPVPQHMAASGIKYAVPVPLPSGSFPDRSYGYLTPVSAHFFSATPTSKFVPPSSFPTPVYPDVPMPSSWAQDIGDQPNSMFVFFLTGPYRSSPGDQPTLVTLVFDQPALGAPIADAPSLITGPGDE